MRIDSEMLIGSIGMEVYSRSIQSWLPPYENDLIDDAMKLKILDNIRAAFHYSGSEIVVS